LAKASLKSLLLAVLAGLVGAGYMLFEAQWLRLRHRRLEIAGLPPALEGLKILHISDLHAGAPSPSSRAIKKAVTRAAHTGADIILFTGDMTDKKRDVTPLMPLLAELSAPLGKFTVLGNHDHGLRKTFMHDMWNRMTGKSGRGKYETTSEELPATVSRYRKIFESAGIELLENDCRTVEVRGETIRICGVDDLQYGYADLGAVARHDKASSLNVLLSHSPDAFPLLEPGAWQLVLAGHTHGGQICIPHPRKGKILLSTSGSCFGSGIYRREDMLMHVSPGVGTTLLPFRLLSRPEITVLELAVT
jgi:predicted MPP superfamily phosphohydrolase